MRITNQIMINNTLSNLNKNKIVLDTLSTQLSTEKKIQVASDDPIVAIRALRYRFQSTEIDQYLDNIDDASGWLEVTEDALDDTLDLLEDMVTYFTEASNGTNDLSDRETIISTLESYMEAIYSDANTEYSGRTVFTGYKSSETYTFTEDEEDTSYFITQDFDSSDIEDYDVLISNCDVSSVNSSNVASLDMTDYDECEYTTVKRITLAYDDLSDCVESIDYTNSDGTTGSITNITTMSSTDDGAYEPDADEVIYLEDTGELILGDDVCSTLVNAESFSFSYTKTGFESGDIKPEQCFDCYDITDLTDSTLGGETTSTIAADTTLLDSDYATKYTYNDDQDISYTINFNQELTINTQGSDVYTYEMQTDLNDVTSAVSDVADIEDDIEELEELQESYDEDSTEYENIATLLELKNQELEYAEEKMQEAFENALSEFSDYYDNVSLEKSDVGARETRLELAQTRLEAQETVVTELETDNESVDVTEIAVEYAAAESVYDASLAAAAKIIQNSLLDFI